MKSCSTASGLQLFLKCGKIVFLFFFALLHFLYATLLHKLRLVCGFLALSGQKASLVPNSTTAIATLIWLSTRISTVCPSVRLCVFAPFLFLWHLSFAFGQGAKLRPLGMDMATTANCNCRYRYNCSYSSRYIAVCQKCVKTVMLPLN